MTVSQRPVCLMEPEHFGCLNMISSERKTGGSRGSGNRCEVTSPHCHPIPHACCSNVIATVANTAMKEHKARVDADVPVHRREPLGEGNQDTGAAEEEVELSMVDKIGAEEEEDMARAGEDPDWEEDNC